jgi:hypothetical protein
VSVVDIALSIASVFPRVDDPWPNTIGIELPFVFAGAGGMLADFTCGAASRAARDEAMRRGGIYGFRLGAAFYVVSFLNQLVSG